MPRTKTPEQPATPAAVDIPKLNLHPAVVKVRTRHDAIAAELKAVRKARAAAEVELRAGPDTPDWEIEGRLIAEQSSTEPVAQLREARNREKALAHALGLVADEVKTTTDAAAREITAQVRETVWLPAAKRAVTAWLAACQVAEELRNLVEDLRSADLGNGLFTPFGDRVPLSLGDLSGFQAYAQELIHDGFTTVTQVNDALPGTL